MVTGARWQIGSPTIFAMKSLIVSNTILMVVTVILILHQTPMEICGSMKPYGIGGYIIEDDCGFESMPTDWLVDSYGAEADTTRTPIPTRTRIHRRTPDDTDTDTDTDTDDTDTDAHAGGYNLPAMPLVRWHRTCTHGYGNVYRHRHWKRGIKTTKTPITMIGETFRSKCFTTDPVVADPGFDVTAQYLFADP